MKEIANCPSALAAGYDTYSPVALRRLFDKQKVSHMLPYETIERSEEDAQLFMENKKRISISGVQSKYSMGVKDGGGDFRLAPAYDLLSTRIHVDDTDFALNKGLFKTDRSEFFKGGKAIGVSFKQFALSIGLPETIADKELSFFTTKHPLIDELIDRSFLSEKTKRQYRTLYQTKRNRLAYMKL